MLKVTMMHLGLLQIPCRLMPGINLERLSDRDSMEEIGERLIKKNITTEKNIYKKGEFE